MPGHSHLLDPVLINTVGHTAGILLFGFIVILITRDWRNFGVRQTRLSLLAAYLALGWNAGSLTALASNGRGPIFIGLVMTASFAILSLLPAVLLHSFSPVPFCTLGMSMSGRRGQLKLPGTISEFRSH